PDGTRIAVIAREYDPPGTGQRHAIEVLDAPSGRLLRRIDLVGPGRLSDLAYSPDGTRIAACGGITPELRVWDAGTGALTFDLRGSFKGVQHVAFRPDGSRLVSTEGSTAHEWDVSADDDSSGNAVPGRTLPNDPFLALNGDGSRMAVSAPSASGGGQELR